MKIPNSRALSRSAVRVLVGDAVGSRDEEMSRRCLCEVYRLASGAALLVFEDGRGRSYDSYDEFRAFIGKQSDRLHVAQHAIPHEQNFLDQLPGLIAGLANLIGVDNARLDLTEPSLGVVDHALRRLGKTTVLTPEIFPSVVAYVGEVIRRRIGGSWKLIGTSEGRWEPEIIDRGGRGCGLLGIYKEILEHDTQASVAAYAQVTIMWHE